MKRYFAVRRAFVAGASLFAALVSPLHSQTQIVVTGTREAIAAERLAADVVVIDAARIAASAADSIEDLLRREAGLQLARAGGPGASAGMLIRGGNSGHTLVLVDGVRIGSATTGLAEFEGLSLAAVERIEVLRGPASSLYGADAVGGVVQIFTRRGTAQPEASARLAVGGYGAREAAVSGSAAWGAVDVAASLAREQNRGVSTLRPNDLFGNFNPDRDGFARSTAQLQLGLAPAPGQRISLQALASRLNAQYDASEFAPPNYAQDNTPDFRNRLAMHSLALAYQARWSSQWSTSMRLADQESDLHAGGTLIDHYRTTRRQADAQASWQPLADQQLTFALDHLSENAQSSAFLRDVQRRNAGAVLAYAGRLGGVDLQADARRDDNSQFGIVNTGRLGASVSLTQAWRVRALLGTTFKAPSLNDLYYPGYGVASIQPERGRSRELGVDGRWGETRINATIYRNDVRELIGYEADRSHCPPGFEYDFGCARNIGRARLQGATLSGGTRWGAWGVRATIDFLDAKNSASGARLTRRAAHQENVAVDWRSGAWTVAAELLRLGDRPEGGRRLAGYTTLDLKARWQVTPQWQLEAKVMNLSDRDYEPALDYRPLGRQAWLGLRWAGP